MDKLRILVKGIVKDANKYLVVEKWYDDNFIDPCRWEFVDGELALGESPEAAVQRVLFEKTGMTCEVQRILYTWTFERGDDWNIGMSFLCSTENPEVVLSEDLNNCKWIEFDEFHKYIGNKAVLGDAIASLQ